MSVMVNPVNQELRELRMSKEHYENILRTDDYIVNGVIEDDGRPRLSSKDKERIHLKLDGINSKISELLLLEDDVSEVVGKP